MNATTPDSSSRAVVLRTSGMQLAKQKVQTFLAALPLGGAEFGVSRGYIVKMTHDLLLSPDDLDYILAARKNFQAGLPRIRELLQSGLTAEEAYALFQTQRVVAETLPSRSGNVSLRTLSRFTQTFPSVPPDLEDLGLIIIGTFQAVQQIFPWIRHVNLALRMLCEAAENFGLADVSTVLDVMESRQSLGAKWVDDSTRDGDLEDLPKDGNSN